MKARPLIPVLLAGVLGIALSDRSMIFGDCGRRGFACIAVLFASIER